MRATVVSSSEVWAQGNILRAEYWVDRLPGETYEQWRIRKDIEKLDRQIADFQRRIEVKQAQIAALSGRLPNGMPETITAQFDGRPGIAKNIGEH